MSSPANHPRDQFLSPTCLALHKPSTNPLIKQSIVQFSYHSSKPSTSTPQTPSPVKSSFKKKFGNYCLLREFFESFLISRKSAALLSVLGTHIHKLPGILFFFVATSSSSVESSYCLTVIKLIFIFGSFWCCLMLHHLRFWLFCLLLLPHDFC